MSATALSPAQQKKESSQTLNIPSQDEVDDLLSKASEYIDEYRQTFINAKGSLTYWLTAEIRIGWRCGYVSLAASDTYRNGLQQALRKFAVTKALNKALLLSSREELIRRRIRFLQRRTERY